MNNELQGAVTDIAIVGVAGRFPGADDVEAFWANIQEGVESIRTFDECQLRDLGVSAETIANPNFVKRAALLNGVDQFDAAFFGYSPREAEEMDPQHRLFLEISWQALENAGYDAARFDGAIGVYAGAGVNTYLLRNLGPSGRFSDLRDISSLQGLMNGNNKDSMSTTVAYQLDLRGPAVTVQTACSTSLAAVHVACRSLLSHESDMALAGGVWINMLHDGGYLHQPGAILSSDGYCRAFDAKADGTVIGSGVGAVVLKRLADARADGDTIIALIKGSAMNNDGAAKVGYTAPGVEGQAEVILAAQTIADVDPQTVTYVEAHGTGTTMGDPIEIAALTEAFRQGTDRCEYCAVGSVKTNVGHLDAAAGIAGLIKTALALKHCVLPASLNFETPNPLIDFAASPFYVNTQSSPWPEGSTPRRAGVSSFGIGGTNVHVILEEAPPPEVSSASGQPQLLPVSARTPGALERSLDQLASYMADHPEMNTDDIAHTLQQGRKTFASRAVALVSSTTDAAEVLGQRPSSRLYIAPGPALAQRSVAFLFPGQGAQHPGMTSHLYRQEPTFRVALDRCVDTLQPMLGVDLRTILFADIDSTHASERLSETALTQPALFAVEYALATLWISHGVKPQAMLGHSIGEYVAACLAGVFELNDALKIVAERGRLLQALPPGAMVAVGLAEPELIRYLPADCDIAAVNSEHSCAVSGPTAAIEKLEKTLSAAEIAVQSLHVSHAFHSSMVEPACAALAKMLTGMPLRAPSIPFLSNVTGQWITTEQATDPNYWAQHLRSTVRFAEGVEVLLQEPSRVLIEVGPGEALTQLCRRHPSLQSSHGLVASQPHPKQRSDGSEFWLMALGRLWALGVDVDWPQPGEQHGACRRRVPLPTYPFETQSYWVPTEPLNSSTGLVRAKRQQGSMVRPLDEWFYAPSWERDETPASSGGVLNHGDWGITLVFGQQDTLTSELLKALEERGEHGVLVLADQHREQPLFSESTATIKPGFQSHYKQLLEYVGNNIGNNVGCVSRVLHLWSARCEIESDSWEQRQALGFFSLAAMAAALPAEQSVHIEIVTRGIAEVLGDESLEPGNATLLGTCRVIPQEYTSLSCRLVDVSGVPPGEAATRLAHEGDYEAPDNVAAYRGTHRWVQRFIPVRCPAPAKSPWREEGVYLITGGLGGIGQTLALHLARTVRAKLVLVGRSAISSQQQQAIEQMRQAGAQVHIAQADIACPQALDSVLHQVHERFGALHGVFHLAGQAGGGSVEDASPQRAADVLRPKVSGTNVLLKALEGEQLDFMLLFSSLSTVAGGLGKLDYCAANAYLDVVAAQSSRQGIKTIVAGWDSWRDVGMAGEMAMPGGVGIAPEEGMLACERLLASGHAHLLVSTLDLHSRLERVRGDLLSQPFEMEQASRGSGHARPALATPFEAAEGELEEGIAAIWQEMLGISEIGRWDNFFELGGDSLLAIQILAKVRGRYTVELQPAPFFKNPTVEGLSALVEARFLNELGVDELETSDMEQHA